VSTGKNVDWPTQADKYDFILYHTLTKVLKLRVDDDIAYFKLSNYRLVNWQYWWVTCLRSKFKHDYNIKIHI